MPKGGMWGSGSDRCSALETTWDSETHDLGYGSYLSMPQFLIL